MHLLSRRSNDVMRLVCGVRHGCVDLYTQIFAEGAKQKKKKKKRILVTVGEDKQKQKTACIGFKLVEFIYHPALVCK